MSPARFGIAVFLGAFLLFQVQLILAKRLLPWFGGAPAVWTTCMLFFQVALLLGYAYAHALARAAPRRQRDAHLALLAAALLLLAVRAAAWPSPLTPGEEWKPDPAAGPVPLILALLAASAGVPYLVVADTGPLVQSWFARVRPGASPYRLFALSNLGSLLGLLSYPFWSSRGCRSRARAGCGRSASSGTRSRSAPARSLSARPRRARRSRRRPRRRRLPSSTTFSGSAWPPWPRPSCSRSRVRCARTWPWSRSCGC